MGYYSSKINDTFESAVTVLYLLILLLIVINLFLMKYVRYKNDSINL